MFLFFIFSINTGKQTAAEFKFGSNGENTAAERLQPTHLLKGK